MANFFFTVGTVLLLALIGGVVAYKLKQSPLVGYLSIGLLVSAITSMTVLGAPIRAIFSSTTILEQLSQIGLVMLLFFIGLNISTTHFKKAGKLAITLAIIDLAVTLFTGFIIGAIFHWDIENSLFLAFILSQSSIIITAKTMEDTMKLSGADTEILLTMLIIEDFISILLVFIANGYMISSTKSPNLITIESVGIVAILLLFTLFIFVGIPFLKMQLFKNKNDELLTIFGISMVFVVSAVLNVFGITPAIGGFFAGMIFAETKLAKEFEVKLAPIKYLFAAIFFVSFGLMINVTQLFDQWQIIFLAVALIIIDELLIMSSFAYLFGFSARSAMVIGVGSLPRTEGSVIFANIALSIYIASAGVLLTKAYVLMAITGGVAILTSIITPVLFRHHVGIADLFRLVVPAYMRYPGAVISRTLRPLFFYRRVPLRKKEHISTVIFVAYGGVVMALLFLHATADVYFYPIVPVLGYLIWWATKKAVKTITYNTRYASIGINTNSAKKIQTLVAFTVTTLLMAVILVSLFLVINWIYSLLILFFAFVLLQLKYYSFYKTLLIRH